MFTENIFSRCYTSFNISTCNGRTRIEKMECETALDWLAQEREQFDSNVPRSGLDLNTSFVSNVTIKKGCFGKERWYDALSHRKFHCYLECMNELETDLEITKCVKTCRKIVDRLSLNNEDRAERPPSFSDFSGGPIIRKHFGNK